MSADRSAAQDLAGEEGPSASEGLRQDTRTSNSEMYDNCPTSSSNPGQQSASGNEGVSSPTHACPESNCILKHLTLQIPGIHLRIQQLELETAQPERREAARARKKLTKQVQRKLSDSGKTDEDKIKYLEGVFSQQASCYTACVCLLRVPKAQMLMICGSNRLPSRPGLRTSSFP